MENVASMSREDRDGITATLELEDAYMKYPMTPYALDAALLGPVRRPRLYWSSFEPRSPDLAFEWDEGSEIHRGRLLAPVERGLASLESKQQLEVIAFEGADTQN